MTKECSPLNVEFNPFYQNSALLFNSPSFDKIRNEHFKPDFDKGIEEGLAQIEAIVNNAEPNIQPLLELKGLTTKQTCNYG